MTSNTLPLERSSYVCINLNLSLETCIFEIKNQEDILMLIQEIKLPEWLICHKGVNSSTQTGYSETD